MVESDSKLAGEKYVTFLRFIFGRIAGKKRAFLLPPLLGGGKAWERSVGFSLSRETAPNDSSGTEDAGTEESE